MEQITVGYSTRTNNPKFTEYLKLSSGLKSVDVIEKINTGNKSLSEIYNEIISESKTDIIVLCHDDIYFDSKKWGEKLIKHFEKTDYGILGVAGTTYLPSSGQWWEDSSKMVGIVNHEHNGKKWESKYSNDLGSEIQKTVIVDGLFIAIHKKRLSNLFDTSVKGFHMYDVNFCFNNFINKVNIGVFFNIRITHKSIGQTNKQWEENREIFSLKNKNLLPKQIILNKNDKLKILFFVKNFEKYFDDIVSLLNSKQDITIVSENIPLDSKKILNKLGAKIFKTNEIPGYKLGDGRSFIKTNNGVIKSEIGEYYKTSNMTYDCVFCNNIEYFNIIKVLYSHVPKVYESLDGKIPQHNSVKEIIDSNQNDLHQKILDSLNKLPNINQKIKILSGWSEKGGSTTALINLTNYFNDIGLDCTFYGPHKWHLTKCKSDLSSNLKLDRNDILITHFISLKERPPVKKVILTSHEKWWFRVGQIPRYWDTVVFLHNKHKDYHSDYIGEYEIIPNLKEELLPNKKIDSVKNIAGVIGSIENRKQTHISIKRALDDDCEKILLFGKINEEKYFEENVKPLLSDKVELAGFIENKQSIYDSIGKVYHSSLGEVACLVKDECYLTNTEFYGNEETKHEVSKLTNNEIIEKWKKIMEI